MFLKVVWGAIVFVPGGQLPEVDSKQQCAFLYLLIAPL